MRWEEILKAFIFLVTLLRHELLSPRQRFIMFAWLCFMTRDINDLLFADCGTHEKTALDKGQRHSTNRSEADFPLNQSRSGETRSKIR